MKNVWPEAIEARSTEAPNLLALIDRLIDVASESGEGLAGQSRRLRELRQRLVAERFHLAILGQFKRGKSTLVNALIGEPLLPSSVLPLTSIPTFLSPGPARLIRVFFLDETNREFPDLSPEQATQVLNSYVTEEQNPGNKHKVSWVEVEHPAPLLNQGVVIIDTPGIGSTFRHNTEATLAFLPQCDAALFVMSADPPITDVELDFLKAVRRKVSRLFFVMNKVDYLDADETSRAVEFFRKTVTDIAVLNGDPVYAVSAKKALQARLRNDPDLWQNSGVARLENRLNQFLRQEKGKTLQQALARKTSDVAADALMQIRLQCRSLEMPLNDLEQRATLLDDKITEAERERTAMGDLLAGDRKRAVEFLEDRADQTRRDARSHLEDLLGEELKKIDDPDLIEKTVQARFAEEIPVFFNQVLRSFFDAIAGRVREVLQPHESRADLLIESIRRTAAELFDIPYRAPDSTRALESTHKPYWVTYNWNTLISPIPEDLLHRFLPAGIRQKQIRKRLAGDIETLVVRNVENVRWATLRNLEDAFRRFGSALEERLEETIEATRGAIRLARDRRQASLQSVDGELRVLRQKASEILVIEQALSTFADDFERGVADHGATSPS
ncbi:MAG TPA: dynamin family protein [Candidatus Binatia bacterium]